MPIQCVLEADLNKNHLIIYSTDQAHTESFLNEARIEIVEKEFDISLIDNRPKLSDLLLEFETQEDIVMIENERGILNFCGFKEKAENVYNKLCDLA